MVPEILISMLLFASQVLAGEPFYAGRAPEALYCGAILAATQSKSEHPAQIALIRAIENVDLSKRLFDIRRQRIQIAEVFFKNLSRRMDSLRQNGEPLNEFEEQIAGQSPDFFSQFPGQLLNPVLFLDPHQSNIDLNQWRTNWESFAYTRYFQSALHSLAEDPFAFVVFLDELNERATAILCARAANLPYSKTYNPNRMERELAGLNSELKSLRMQITALENTIANLGYTPGAKTFFPTELTQLKKKLDYAELRQSETTRKFQQSLDAYTCELPSAIAGVFLDPRNDSSLGGAVGATNITETYIKETTAMLRFVSEIIIRTKGKL